MVFPSRRDEAATPTGSVDRDGRADVSERSARSPWVVTWTVLAGSFALGVNFTILAVSRPAIAADLDVDASTLVWLISGPILANALVTPTAGKLGDLRGHRPTYLIGLVGSVVFAVVSALAPGAGWLVGSRIAGAVVGGAIGPSAMAIINLTFEPHRRARALGYWSLVGAGGPVVGLVVGGPLVDAFGWRTIFWGQVPLMALALVLAWRILPDTPRATDARFDVAGTVALSVGLVGLLVAAERGRVWGWGSWPTVATLVGGTAALVAFARVEARVAEPLLPLRYFRRRTFVVPLVVLLFAQFGYMGGFILAPKLLAELDGRTAAQTSLLLVPRPLTFALAGVLAGYGVARIGSRRIAVVGAVAVVVSLLGMAWTTSDVDLVSVVVAIALSGLGMGMAQPTISASIANSVDDRDLGVAGAASQMVAQVATSLGMNVVDALQAASVAALGTAGSYRRAYVVAAVVTAAAVVAATRLAPSGRDRGRAERPAPDGVELST